MVQRVKESERTERICLHCEILTLLWHGDFANPIPLLGISSLARDWSFEEKWTKRVFKTSPARYDRVNVTRTAMVSMAQWRIKNRLTHWILGSWIHGMIWMVMVYDDLWSGYVWICLDGMALDHFGSFWIILDDDSATDSATILDNSKLAIPRGLKSSLKRTIKAAIRFLGWLCRLCAWAFFRRPWNTLKSHKYS